MVCAVVFASIAVGLLTACGHSARHGASSTANRLTFGYDASRPLGYVDRGVVARRSGITVHDIAYTSGGERVDGYLVEGSAPRRRPGIVLVHGSGGDRRQLLGHAFALARRGAVALTITEPSTVHPPRLAHTGAALLAEARAVQVRDVVAVRRAADVPASLPAVDAQRLGYLGWSAGAKTGTFVAASDLRFKALALLSAGADKLSAFVAAAPADLRPLVRRQLGSIDPIRYIGWARPGTLLLEDGAHDAVVPHQPLLNIIQAAPRGTTVRWYPAGHRLNAAAYRDAFAWLLNKLKPRP
jgi:dienelactone hydrolase